MCCFLKLPCQEPPHCPSLRTLRRPMKGSRISGRSRGHPSLPCPVLYRTSSPGQSLVPASHLPSAPACLASPTFLSPLWLGTRVPFLHLLLGFPFTPTHLPEGPVADLGMHMPTPDSGWPLCGVRAMVRFLSLAPHWLLQK